MSFFYRIFEMRSTSFQGNRRKNTFLKVVGIDRVDMVSCSHYERTCGHVRDQEGGGIVNTVPGHDPSL
jgi:hypothetical protein